MSTPSTPPPDDAGGHQGEADGVDEARRQQPARHVRGSCWQSRRRGGAQPHAARSACSLGHGRGARAYGACAGATGAASPATTSTAASSAVQRAIVLRSAPRCVRPIRRREPDGDGAVGEDRDRSARLRRRAEGDEGRRRCRAPDGALGSGSCCRSGRRSRRARRPRRAAARRVGTSIADKTEASNVQPARRAGADRLSGRLLYRVAHGAAQHVGSRVQAGGAGAAPSRPGGRPGPRRRRWRAWWRRLESR